MWAGAKKKMGKIQKKVISVMLSAAMISGGHTVL